MAKAGQHHNDGASSAKPRGHETSRGRNHPDRSQTITTGSYKKQETYRQQAAEGSSRTSDQGRGMTNENPWKEDIREAPTTSGSTRARKSDITGGRSGSDSNDA